MCKTEYAEGGAKLQVLRNSSATNDENKTLQRRRVPTVRGERSRPYWLRSVKRDKNVITMASKKSLTIIRYSQII